MLEVMWLLGRLVPDHKTIADPDRVVLADPVFQAFRKQRALPAIHPLNEALHLNPILI
jgi:hypothetical protein